MAKMVWLCSTCNKEHTGLSDAEECESSHQTINDVYVKGLSFSASERPTLPVQIVVQLSDKPTDFGVYHLVRHGPKGV